MAFRTYTTLQVMLRYAEMRADMLRREADSYPEGSIQRRNRLWEACNHQDRAERLARSDPERQRAWLNE